LTTKLRLEKPIESSQSILIWLGFLASLLFGLGAVTIMILSMLGFTARQIPLMQGSLVIFGGLICLFMGFAIMRMRAEVTKEDIKTWMFSATREIAWSDVEMVTIPMGGSGIPFLGWNIAVAPRKKQGEPQKIIIVPTALFNNGTLIGKANFEAAVRANPNVIIDDVLISTFDKPPYGVFDNE
jgi:hypothetical protein